MNFLSELYTEIAERIEADIPEVEWIDLWNNQTGYLTTELPFPTPAVFLAFSTPGIDDIGGSVQNVTVQIDLYLFYETFSDTYLGSDNRDRALAYLDTLTRLHALFHGRSGKSFNRLRRVDLRPVDTGGAGNLYCLSFQGLVVDDTARRIFVESIDPDARLEIEKGSAPSIDEAPPIFDVE